MTDITVQNNSDSPFDSFSVSPSSPDSEASSDSFTAASSSLGGRQKISSRYLAIFCLDSIFGHTHLTNSRNRTIKRKIIFLIYCIKLF